MQSALAQMEVNAAAAMAKFKSFRAPAVVKEPEKEAQPPATLAQAETPEPDPIPVDPATEAAVAEACAGRAQH